MSKELPGLDPPPKKKKNPQKQKSKPSKPSSSYCSLSFGEELGARLAEIPDLLGPHFRRRPIEADSLILAGRCSQNSPKKGIISSFFWGSRRDPRCLKGQAKAPQSSASAARVQGLWDF